jgi:predicted RNA polymerase sigma factor
MGHVSAEVEVEELLRRLAPQALGVLSRRSGDFGACEDAVQEALLDAATTWRQGAIPANPVGWLVTAASRRLVEIWRNESARRRREVGYALMVPVEGPASSVDDSLALLFMCCHPVVTPSSQVPLTLRALGGLTTAEIARALLVPPATVAQRISRAKARIRESGARFHVLTAADRADRLATVLHVLYLIFNEGYTSTSGEGLHRVELTAEAIRLTRQLHAGLPGEGEVAGLLALMLLTDARRPARTRADGALVPLAEQDRSLWDAHAIAEGVDLITTSLAAARPGPYQLQAAIAAVHDEAARAQDTDWPQISALYDVLRLLAPGPMVTLNRIVAVAMVRGAAVALRQLDGSAADLVLAGHRVDAVRAHLLDEIGDHDGARECFRRAAERTLSLPERRYLLSRAIRRTSTTMSTQRASAAEA